MVRPLSTCSRPNAYTVKGLYKEPFYFFIDVETNGLPDYYPDPETNPEAYPEIIQIAILCCDSDGKRIWQGDKYIIPDGWEIKEDVRRFLNIDKHKEKQMRYNGMFINNRDDRHIEEYFSLREPDKTVGEYLSGLFGMLSGEYDVAYIIGHNVDYDINCLKALFYRNLKDEEYGEFCDSFNYLFLLHLPKMKKICTMKSTTEFCGLTNKYGQKYPKLEELYFRLFNENIEGAHDAKVDVFNTAKCYWKLRDLGQID